MKRIIKYSIIPMILLITTLSCFLTRTVEIDTNKGSQNNNIILINEIMYNPEQNDDFNEWVELHNPMDLPINLSGWSLTDNYEEDFLEGDLDHGSGTMTIPPKGYAVIADHETKIYENYSIPDKAIRIYVDDLSIGNGLGNDADKLILKNSLGSIVDAVEWGQNYTDIPGSPAETVSEGHSMARYYEVDTNDSKTDFYEGIAPTPGDKNILLPESNLSIELYSMYVPKIERNADHSIPFAIKINITGFSSNESYELKAYVAGKNMSILAATQTWNGTKWRYSGYYTHTIKTDEHGNWSNWVYLRFKKDYIEYKKNIENNHEAYLKIKVRKNKIFYVVSKKIYLLDMDKSTSNGTLGGYIIGKAEKNNVFLQNKTIIVENSNIGIITGIYITEDNTINEGFISKPGYYKTASPVGSGYTIKFLEKNGSIIYTITNIDVEQGEYGVDICSQKNWYQIQKNETIDIPITVKNIGDFHDIISLNIDYAPEKWYTMLEKNKVALNPGEMYDLYLHVTPAQIKYGENTINISATSEKDNGKHDEITIQIEIVGSDLTITKIATLNICNKKNSLFGEGEIIRIKAYVKNIGDINTSEFNVTFYYDNIDKNHCIGKKHYSSIGKYQKYPMVEWDTKNLIEGDHTIFVIVDEKDHVKELNETNNKATVQIRIYNTSTSSIDKKIVITELYYHTHPGVNNEYISIHNPTNSGLDISGWYITNQPHRRIDEQTKIVFPNNTVLNPKKCLYITQNTSAFQRETGWKPDFEYAVDSNHDVPQMEKHKTLILSNNGGAVALKDRYNHTVDIVVYGDINYEDDGWNGPPVKDSDMGVVLKRNFHHNLPIDTNTCNDWNNIRRYGIGQSDFSYQTINFTGEIKTFVSPDCSFEAIVEELHKATETIYLNMYEFTDPFLCNELIETLKRNVSIYLFLDGSPVGGIEDREKILLNKIAENGGKIRFIVNDKKNKVFARYSYDHAKYLVIDNKTVIIESCNWVKTGVPKNPSFGNREWGIIVRNKKVADYFLKVFMDDWNPDRADSYSIDDIDLTPPQDYFIDYSISEGKNYVPLFKPKTFNSTFTATPVLSPDTSEETIEELIQSAKKCIYVEQLYIYLEWNNRINPFIEKLVNKSKHGIEVKVILNYNPDYKTSNEKNNQTRQYLEKNGVEVKIFYTNWSYFTNMHNKGMVVDNRSVLISSINWNENSVTKNREAGIIIENGDVAKYYAEVFLHDWKLQPREHNERIHISLEEYKKPFMIALIFGITIALVVRDWRKREWR